MKTFMRLGFVVVLVFMVLLMGCRTSTIDPTMHSPSEFLPTPDDLDSDWDIIKNIPFTAALTAEQIQKKDFVNISLRQFYKPFTTQVITIASLYNSIKNASDTFERTAKQVDEGMIGSPEALREVRKVKAPRVGDRTLLFRQDPNITELFTYNLVFQHANAIVQVICSSENDNTSQELCSKYGKIIEEKLQSPGKLLSNDTLECINTKRRYDNEQDIYMVSFTFIKGDGVQFDKVYMIGGGVISSQEDYRIQKSDAYYFEILGQDGCILYRLGITPSFFIFADPGGGRETNEDTAIITVPSKGAQIMRVRKDNEILAELNRTPHKPVVEFISPLGGETVRQNESFRIQWNATDADGDSFIYAILDTDENNGSLHTLNYDYNETVYDLDTSWIGPGRYRIKIIASDGFNSGVAFSPVFEIVE